MKIYVHHEGKTEPDAIEVPATETLGDALRRGEDTVVAAALEDQDEQLELTVTIDAAGIVDRAHVFAGTRHRIVVEVLYNGETREREFSASSTVRRVFAWAAGEHGFDLSPADAVEHTLALCATSAVPPEDVHVGSLDSETPGRACFMLIAKHRFEG